MPGDGDLERTHSPLGHKKGKAVALVNRIGANIAKVAGGVNLSSSGRELLPKTAINVPDWMWKNKDLILEIGKQRFAIHKNDNEFYLFDIKNKICYNCESNKEYIIGRKGNIQADASNETASRMHLKIKINNNGELVLDDMSTNGTRYSFEYKEDFIHNPLADNPYDNEVKARLSAEDLDDGELKAILAGEKPDEEEVVILNKEDFE